MNKRKNRLLVQELAASQHGFFSTAQAQDLGVSRQVLNKMERSGLVSRIIQGVYRFESIPDNVLDVLRAIWMSTNPHKMTFERLVKPDGFVIGGRTAAALHKIGDFYLSPYFFFVPKRYQSRNIDAKFITRVVDPKDITIIEGLPVTSIARTLFDLKVDHEDPSLFEQAIVDAIHRPNDSFDYERLCQLFLEHAESSPRHDTGGLQDMLADAHITLIQAIDIDPKNEGKTISSNAAVIRKSDGKLIPIDLDVYRQLTESKGQRCLVLPRDL